MLKQKWNYLVDVVMFGLTGSMVFIGVLLGLFLPSGPVTDEGSKYLWGLHRHQWGDIHLILALVFVGFFLRPSLAISSWTWDASRGTGVISLLRSGTP